MSAQCKHHSYNPIDSGQECHSCRIVNLEAELEQSQEIRADMEALLSYIGKNLYVPVEPHQTWNERIMERVDEVAAARQHVTDYGKEKC